MEITLLRADISDAKALHTMQIKAFKNLLEKYQDFDTSPANEGVEKVFVLPEFQGKGIELKLIDNRKMPTIFRAFCDENRIKIFVIQALWLCRKEENGRIIPFHRRVLHMLQQVIFFLFFFHSRRTVCNALFITYFEKYPIQIALYQMTF